MTDTLPTGTDVTVEHQLEQHGRDRVPVPTDVHEGNHLEHEQTVTVTAGQDDDAANDMATLTHNPSGAELRLGG